MKSFSPPGEAFNLREVRPAFIVHLALIIIWCFLGVLQFVPMVRKSLSFAYHRAAGSIFLCVSVGVAISGLSMATRAFGGTFIGQVGMFVLSLCFLIAAFNGYWSIKVKNIPAHRDWMTRLFAYGTSVITLRIFIPLGLLISPRLGLYTTSTSSERRRVAFFWVFNNALPNNFDLSLATLLNSGADLVDVHVLAHALPAKYAGLSNTLSNLTLVSVRNKHKHVMGKRGPRGGGGGGGGGGSDNHRRSMSTYSRNEQLNEQVFFHIVSSQEWKRRIELYLDVMIDYDLSLTHRKKADLKPMLGLLFQDLIPPSRYAFWCYGDSDGFFGSFNKLVDASALGRYDVVSGFPAPDAARVQVMAGRVIHCTGAWTLWRNSHKINSLFKRSVNWQNMVKDGSKVYAFDEDTTQEEGHENMHQVLELSDDIRKCCTSTKQPSVKTSNDVVFIAEMTTRFLNTPNSSIFFRWNKEQGITVTVDGTFGFGDVYKQETVRPLFFHFLEWKYCCGHEIDQGIAKLTFSLSARNLSIFDIECFEMRGGGGVGQELHKRLVFSEC